MYPKPLQIFVAVVLAAMLVSAGAVSAADQWLGTWKLNLAKSKYSRPELAPNSQTLLVEAWEGGLTLITNGVDGQGQTVHHHYMARFDGKDYPTMGLREIDMVTLKRIDDFSFETTWKSKGKRTIATTSVVSRDGKTLTITQSGKDAYGRSLDYMAVYDRQ